MPEPFDPKALAKSYRLLVLTFGVQLLITPFVLTAGRPNATQALNLAAGFLNLILLFALAFLAFQTAKAMGSSVSWLWGLAMLIPCANVLALLALSARATKQCLAEGIPVGFLGPKLDQ